jgi:hypothetical protein
MLGSLGLIHHLQGVALGGPAADLKKRAAKLPEPIRQELEALLKKHRDELKVAKDKHTVSVEEFLARNALPKRMSTAELNAAKKVVAAFINGVSEKAPGIESTGNELRVGGKVVGSRSPGNYKKVRICPGNFGESALSRKAANAALSILGAGIGVSDRDGVAFLSAGGRGGRIYSPNACYDVQVNSRLEKAAMRALKSSIAPAYGGGEAAYSAAMMADAEARAARAARITSMYGDEGPAGYAMDGLRGGKKRRKYGKKRNR